VNLREKLEDFHDRLLALAGALKFDKRNTVDLHRMALYGSMLELTRGVCTLLKFDARLGAPSLFRSFLEAAVELTNLLQDPGYVDNMNASHKDQWLKVLWEAQRGKNPYLASIAQVPELDAQIEKETAELKVLRDKGRGPLKVFERFKKANMEKEYKSLYNFLSCDAHSNIRALISRHLTFTENDFEVAYYKDEPIESFISILDSTAGLLIHASAEMHKRYQSGKDSDVREMMGELQCLRAKYVA
jgi:hypothetical protein